MTGYYFVSPKILKKNESIDFCSSDSECGVNICQCISQRKELIAQKDKLCARYCPGIPRCINNKCVLDEKSIFCGGIEGIPCPTGYNCELDGNYPDAGGKCIKK